MAEAMDPKPNQLALALKNLGAKLTVDPGIKENTVPSNDEVLERSQRTLIGVVRTFDVES